MEKPDQPLRVLVADDESRLQVIMRLWLIKAGHEVVIARNGQEAMDRLAAESFDVLITDINMPMVNGIEMVRQLQAGGCSPRLIIILTSRCDVDDLQREFSSPRVRVFPKPFSPRDMMNLIESHFISSETPT
ncbi:MAG: response regulator [Sedimentisphaerales bacterium]|nr:response regulator [Sedimentisphaerales bacterium]